jgi:hypothetical protein
MSKSQVLTSVCRIADFDENAYEIEPLPQDQWATADYVAAQVVGSPSRHYGFELTSGRIMEALEGTTLIGTLGVRAATLEATGSWRSVGEDGLMHALTGAGLFGRATSVAPAVGNLTTLRYLGHVWRDARKVSMHDFVPPLPSTPFAIPTVLLIGTSMSSGKTTTGRIVIDRLTRAGLNVAGAKFTGAGRFRDVLSFADAGAEPIIDFVDAGLPSTVVSRTEFDNAMQHMLNRIAQSGADVLVAEAGASPLEPYNGEAVCDALGANVKCTILCASDPYAVLGVQHAFATTPDLVTGPTANTDAGAALVGRLTGLEALNLLNPDAHPALGRVLSRCLSIEID